MMVSTKAAPFSAGTVKDEVNSRGLLRARHLVFIDEASRTVLDLLARIAPSEAAVLITGETGTGKELAARHIHEMSGRSGPFVAVNCGAINEHLAESELFGHEAGSFTGATARREGWFEAADGGTLFLDEIGDLPLSLQGKLLRVLQEGEVSRVGSRRSTPVNVRIVSATNVDLAAAVAAGNFRQDLFYRLHIVPVRLPPLRERPNDIEALARYFILHYSERLKRPPPSLHPDALAALKGHSWPGNIRQLENVIHFSLLVNSANEIRVEHLSLPTATATATAARAEAGGTVMRQEMHPLECIGEVLRSCFAQPSAHLLRDIERRIVVDAYRYCESNQVQTAELLGVSRNVIRTLLKRHGLLIDADEVDDCEDVAAPATNRYFGASRLQRLAPVHTQP